MIVRPGRDDGSRGARTPVARPRHSQETVEGHSHSAVRADVGQHAPHGRASGELVDQHFATAWLTPGQAALPFGHRYSSESCRDDRGPGGDAPIGTPAPSSNPRPDFRSSPDLRPGNVLCCDPSNCACSSVGAMRRAGKDPEGRVIGTRPIDRLAVIPSVDCRSPIRRCRMIQHHEPGSRIANRFAAR